MTEPFTGDPPPGEVGSAAVGSPYRRVGKATQ